jgi:hypothetical protein
VWQAPRIVSPSSTRADHTSPREVVHNRSHSVCSASVPATVLTLLVFEMVSKGAVDMAVSDLTINSPRLNLFDLSQPYFYLTIVPTAAAWSKHSYRPSASSHTMCCRLRRARRDGFDRTHRVPPPIRSALRELTVGRDATVALSANTPNAAYTT